MQLVPFLLGALAYAVRARTLARRGRPVAAWRQASFFASLVVVGVALLSPIDLIGEERLFWVHMVQHLLLGDLAALLVVLGLDGAILRPLLALPLVRHLRVLAHPLVALPLWIVNLFAWHLPAAYEAALAHAPVHALEHCLFFATGALMWAAVVEPLPGPGWFGSGWKAAYVLVVRLAAYGPGHRRGGHGRRGGRGDAARLRLALPALDAGGGAPPVARGGRDGPRPRRPRGALRTGYAPTTSASASARSRSCSIRSERWSSRHTRRVTKKTISGSTHTSTR